MGESDLDLLENDDIRKQIFLIRGKQVMMDEDLARLYNILTKRLNEAVKRNPARFPEDYCFQLTKIDYAILRSQIATSKLRSQIVIFKKRGGRTYFPFVFTEQGVAMLAGVRKK